MHVLGGEGEGGTGDLMGGGKYLGFILQGFSKSFEGN